MNDDTKNTADAANSLEHAQRKEWAKDDLRRQWQRIFDDDAPDALREHLEKWARTAEAGELLDWVCVRSMGLPFVRPMQRFCGRCGSGPWNRGVKSCPCERLLDWWPPNAPKVSTDPADAMRALAVLDLGITPPRDGSRGCYSDRVPDAMMYADTPMLAIARYVAVLASRGVMLEVEGTE